MYIYISFFVEFFVISNPVECHCLSTRSVSAKKKIPLFQFWDIRHLRNRRLRLRCRVINAPIKIYRGEEESSRRLFEVVDGQCDYGVNELHLYDQYSTRYARFICMHQTGGSPPPRLSSREKNRKENHRVEMKFFNFARPPSFSSSSRRVAIETGMVRSAEKDSSSLPLTKWPS